MTDETNTDQTTTNDQTEYTTEEAINAAYTALQECYKFARTMGAYLAYARRDAQASGNKQFETCVTLALAQTCKHAADMSCCVGEEFEPGDMLAQFDAMAEGAADVKAAIASGKTPEEAVKEVTDKIKAKYVGSLN